MKDLYILDASGYLYRSYFAIKNMTNSKGQSTNAIYGFLRSLLKLYKDFNPQHLVAVFDGPHNSKSREAIYSDYKAHRTTTPDDLIEQLNWARDVCELLGVPYLSIPEVEADDTMGSIACWAEKEGAKVFLCTSDKDLCQIVDENIHILNTHKENLVLGIKEIVENYGITPQQFIDYLALIGDSSDNIPGIPGCGPKTASALLQQFGSLDQIFRNLHLISGKKQTMLIEGEDNARISKELAKIDTSIPFPQDHTFFELRRPNMEGLKEFYTRMDFKTLIRELETTTLPQIQKEQVIEAQEEQEDLSYTLVNDEQSFNDLIEFLQNHKEISLTAKTSGLKPMKSEWIGISFSVAPKQSWYIPVHGNIGLNKIVDGLKRLFQNESLRFYGHNIKADYHILAKHGLYLKNVIFDAVLASYILNSHKKQHSLEDLMLDYFGRMKQSIQMAKGKNQSIPTMEIYSDFFCQESDFICRLKEKLEKQLEERNLTHLLKEIELPLTMVLADVEHHGIYLNKDRLKEFSIQVNSEIARLEQEIYTLAGEEFNINSSKQLGDILFNKMGIKPHKKTATGLSTNAEVLESLKADCPIAGKVLEYRTVEKLRSTYVDALPDEILSDTKRIHCTFNQTVAATGRLSCQDPNLQNIPIRTEIGRNIREAFIPQKQGWSYLSADYSQIELRLLAHFSEDPELIDAFTKGHDIHQRTASFMYKIPLEEVTPHQRFSAKAVNFGILYGQGPFGLSQELGISNKEASEFISMYFNLYPSVKSYLDGSKEKTRQTGKAVTYTGRERAIPEIHSKNGIIRAAAERFAINSPIQGTAADLIKLAMIKIDEKIKAKNMKAFMILQIHDELIFEAPDEELSELKQIVKETMEGTFDLKIPLTVDISIGKNWKEC